MRTPARCRGCAGRDRPRVQHWRCTRCCMTRCRARRSDQTCQWEPPPCPPTSVWADYSATTGCAMPGRTRHGVARGRRHANARPVQPPPSAALNPLPPERAPVPGRPAGRPGTDDSAILKAQTPEPRPHSQRTALPDSRSQHNAAARGSPPHRPWRLPRSAYCCNVEFTLAAISRRWPQASSWHLTWRLRWWPCRRRIVG